jgi:hypothetical protein
MEGTATGIAQPLDLIFQQPYPDNTDRDVVFCRTLLEALADGTKDAAEAAQEFDAWVTGESTHRLEELRSRPELVETTTYAIVDRASSPNASGYVQLFFQGFSSLCAIFPPHDAGQTRVVEFLEALMAMPAHQAPDSFPNARDLSDVDSMTLWPRGVFDPDPFRIHTAGTSVFSANTQI